MAVKVNGDVPAGSSGGVDAVADYRSGIEQARRHGELLTVTREVDPHLEMCAVAAAFRGFPTRPVLMFEQMRGYPGQRAVFNTFGDRTRFSRLLGFPGQAGVDKVNYLDALARPIPPVVVEEAPCQENVITEDIDISRLFPPIHGAAHVSSLYYQPVTTSRNPLTGTKNTAVYRCAVQGPRRLSVNGRWDQHTGYLLSSSKRQDSSMPIALCIGAHPAVYVAAVTKMGFGEDELGFAGGILGRPVELVKCKTIDLEVPATAEIVIEGEFRSPFELGSEGPWPEYLGYLGMETHPPIMDITAVTFRNDPIVHYQIPGGTPHMLGIGTQASLLRYLRNIAGEFVVDATIVPVTRMHHLIIKVRKTEAHHEGLQMNVALGAFGFLNAIDLVTLVDEDIDITNAAQVEWAVATRCEPTEQVHILSHARSQQVNPMVSAREISGKALTKGKWIIDATKPWQYREIEKGPGIGIFSRSEWPEVDLSEYVGHEAVERWANP